MNSGFSGSNFVILFKLDIVLFKGSCLQSFNHCETRRGFCFYMQMIY